jgi:1,4-dihydroxy-2-naphthoate octaprenyltransferase
MYLLLAGAYVSLAIGIIAGAIPWPAIVALATAPLVVPIVRVVSGGGSPRRLNMALFRTAQLHMRFGAVLAVGLGAWLVID